MDAVLLWLPTPTSMNRRSTYLYNQSCSCSMAKWYLNDDMVPAGEIKNRWKMLLLQSGVDHEPLEKDLHAHAQPQRCHKHPGTL